MSKRLIVILLLTLSVGLLSCQEQADVAAPPENEDIITQKVAAPNSIPITILVKNAFSLNTFEQQAEKKFSDVNIIQVGNYTAEMGIEEYVARLENSDLTDIVMTWPLDVGEEYWSEELLDLSTLPLTGKYNIAMLDNISRNGKLYYLPGPSQVRGIVYNKTLFREKGWQVPTDFPGFIQLCQTIEASGMRSLQLGLGNSEVLDTAFVGYGYDSSFSKPQNVQHLAEYNNGIGSFADNFTPALQNFQTLIDSGILQKNDLNIQYQDRELMLFTRQCAMVEDSVLLTHMGFEYCGCTDEFALLPFFNPGTDSDWTRLYPICYIGVNKKLAAPENKAKYDIVMKLLEYISTPEGQLALIGDNGTMFSSLKDSPLPQAPEIEQLSSSLNAGRFAVFPTLKNAQSALRQGLKAMINGTLTIEDVIELVDKQNLSPPLIAPHLVIGNSAADFTLLETGNFITDAMRSYSKCEIALFLDNGKDGRYNGKGVSGKLYQGKLTSVDLQRILPDLKQDEKCELWKITMTGEALIKTLEYAISVNNHHDGWFYYFSGLQMEYDVTAEPGQRIKKITTVAGENIDPQHLYSIAVMDESVPEELITSCEKTGVLISNILEKEIHHAQTIAPSQDGRFTIYHPTAK